MWISAIADFPEARDYSLLNDYQNLNFIFKISLYF